MTSSADLDARAIEDGFFAHRIGTKEADAPDIGARRVAKWRHGWRWSAAGEYL